MRRAITQIIERLPKSTLHATAACPAHKLLTQMREHRHTHTNTLRTPHIAQFAATISIACLYVFIFHMYIYISDMMSSLLLPVYL